MSNKQNDTLIDAIKNIGYPIRPEFELHPSSNHESLKAGPNSWDDVKDDVSQFGDKYDYEILDLYDHQVFYPTCNAAVQWARKHLPEHLDRFGANGYKIPIKDWQEVHTRATECKLISEDEYVRRMNENDEQARQWDQ